MLTKIKNVLSSLFFSLKKRNNIVAVAFAYVAVTSMVRSWAMLANNQGFMAWFKTLEILPFAILSLLFLFRWNVLPKSSTSEVLQKK